MSPSPTRASPPRNRSPRSSRAALARLEALRARFGDGSEAEKCVLLDQLAKARLTRSSAVLRLHECLLFARAFPDDLQVLDRVERMLARFEARGDLRRFRGVLENSGVAGTAIRFAFFAPTASWLARRCPDLLTIEWPVFERTDQLESRLELLVAWSETPALDEGDLTLRGWIDRLKGPAETDGAFLVRRFDALEASRALRTHFLDELDVPFVVAPGPRAPTRTHARHPRPRTSFQTRPWERQRPDLAQALRRPPLSIRAVAWGEGARLADLAREAMVTRSRDPAKTSSAAMMNRKSIGSARKITARAKPIIGCR
jgi:hypothetical protein